MNIKTTAGKQNERVLRIVLLVAGFTLLIAFRNMLGQFGVSLGYIYILLILIGAYWFKIAGGILSAAAAFIIFLIELYSFPAYPFRDLALNSILIRLLTYILTGICAGYLSTIMQKLQSKLDTLEFYDVRTGCLNSMHIIYSIEQEIKNSGNKGDHFTLILMSVGSYKDINRDYGYMGSNDILKKFINILRKDLRSTDLIGRYGENKFLIIFPGATLGQAESVMKDIAERMQNERITSQYVHGREGVVLDSSFGAAEYPGDGTSLEAIINSAASDLY